MRAVSVGSVVTPSFIGQIHSVFQHTVNVQIAGSETLLAVFASETTDLPQGIRVSPSDFATRSFSPGQSVIRLADRLNLGDHRVELKDAPIYFGTLGGFFPDRIPEKHRLEWVEWSWRAARQRPGGSHAGPFENRISAALSQLKRAVRSQDWQGIQHAVAALVGLGSGLTPSGDDILVGFSAGLRSVAGSDPACREMVWGLDVALRANAMRTNDISRTYLMLAARGLYSSSLRDLCQAICSNTPRSLLEQSAQAVFHTGHTSGCDTARGMLAGLAVWSEE